MNKWTKIGLAVGAGAATIATAHLLNKFIFTNATSRKVTDINKRETFSWKFGDISYTVCGEGSPLLLIHDLQSSSSSYEWKNVLTGLSKNHTVYTMDLLGCGYSHKPNITYTTYMYTQLINDFIVKVIGKKTDIIATGDSAPMTIMTAYNNPDVIGKIMLVNPQNIGSAMINPDSRSDIRRGLLNSPILGTMIYNICMSKSKTLKNFLCKLMHNPNNIKPEWVSAYYENSHLGGSSAKYLYTSCVCHYTTASIARAVKELDNCIYIINGSEKVGASETADEYIMLNPAIEVATVKETNHLPQLEQPKEFIRTVQVFM